jgi:hypothetical protein
LNGKWQAIVVPSFSTYSQYHATGDSSGNLHVWDARQGNLKPQWHRPRVDLTRRYVVRVHAGPHRSTIVLVGDEDRAVDYPTAQDCERGLAEARDLARKIVSREGDPAHLANGIYWAGYLNGGYALPSHDLCPELGELASEFVQIAYGLERPESQEAKRAYALRAREAAEAFLGGRPLPEWEVGMDGIPRRLPPRWSSDY